jgi:spermidine synthase
VTANVTDTPRLHTNSQTVSLSFEGSLIQSCMLLDDPDDLVLDYTRTMMGALLFEPAPKKVLMIGLGGGSMLKYLHRHVPGADLTTVEIHQGVIDMRQDFHIPPDSDRLRILCADGAAFLRQPPERYDLILVDGFNGSGVPDALCSRSFYQHAKAALTPAGLLVSNVQAETLQARMIGQRISKVFDKQTIMVESDEGGNEIVTATNDRTVFDALMADFAARWQALDAVHRETLAVASSRIERALLKTSRPE